jgi:hypothetical protein
MINFYIINSNQTANNRTDFNKENKVFFEKVSLLHLRFYKIITISAYYNLLRFFRVTKKNVYLSYVMVDNSIVSYAFCYPKSFKYPFMGDDDYQIGSVYTDPRFRKKGYSVLTIENILKNINCSRIWYLSYSDNTPSINLCNKLNFCYFNNGVRVRDKYLSFLSIYIITGENSEK